VETQQVTQVQVGELEAGRRIALTIGRGACYTVKVIGPSIGLVKILHLNDKSVSAGDIHLCGVADPADRSKPVEKGLIKVDHYLKVRYNDGHTGFWHVHAISLPTLREDPD
jgi:hypothetical protein